MVGAVGAVVAARRANRPKSFHISDERMEQLQHERREARALDRVIARYDTNKSGRLEADQVSKMLTDMDYTTPENTPPSQEELNFIMKSAKKNSDENHAGLDKMAVKNAIVEWKVYLKLKPQIDDWMNKYDKSQTGKLERPEVKELLQGLNKGLEVTDAEVDWVISEADIAKDGALSRSELPLATAAWYVYCDEKKGCCVLL